MLTTSASSFASSPALSGSFLRKVLRADGLVSIAAGALMLLGGPTLQALLDLPAALLVPAGAGLLAYAAFVLWLSRRPVLPRRGVWATVVINVVWAVDCVVVATGSTFHPSVLGQAFLLAQVATVLVFAELSVIGLRRQALSARA